MKEPQQVKVRSSLDVLTDIPLGSVERVTFYERDEITTDLICCEVVASGQIWTFHEEMPGWDALMAHLAGLASFRQDWFAAVSQTAFQPCEIVAFAR
ncbi:hypothetical protein [Sphingomonas ursincola]|uniref:Uncharacterized protein n=2 Tax=Sphingomonas ursincola TaxID=56361 RepID=A0A7V8RCS7_9SPHN|nr:hypothetical protein [Sphingomonas ursincola]